METTSKGIIIPDTISQLLEEFHPRRDSSATTGDEEVGLGSAPLFSECETVKSKTETIAEMKKDFSEIKDLMAVIVNKIQKLEAKFDDL